MAHPLALSIAQQLVTINTVNPPGNEADAVRFLAPLFKNAGFAVREYQYGPNRSSLVAHKGRTDKPSILLSGHLDTVPFGSQPWSTPPLEAAVIGNRLYGRGSADMKGGVAAITAAAIQHAPHVKDIPLTVVLSANEEIGCDGVSQLIKKGVLPQTQGILVAEPTGNIPCLGHKGVLWLKVLFNGKTAHAAFPDLGDNALVKAARAIVALNTDIITARPHPVMGSATLVTSRCLSGDNYNSVPDLAEIGIDIRSTVNWLHSEVIATVEKLLASYKPEIEVLFDLPPLWTSPESAVVQEIVSCCEQINQQVHSPGIVTFYTDGGILGPGLGDVPVVILGPGDPGMAHQVNECIPIEELDRGVDIYLEILSRLCC